MARGRTTVPNELSEGLVYHSPQKLLVGTDKVLSLYGHFIDEYHGTVPVRLVAARIFLEVGTDPTGTARAQNWCCKWGPRVAGKRQCLDNVFGSEIGLLQINPCNRKLYGLTSADAKDPETNIKYGCKIWNNWTSTFFSEQGGIESAAVWAWLVTAVGPGAARKLRELAGGYNRYDLMNVASNENLMYANKNYWGSQSPELVAWRVGVAISAAEASGAVSMEHDMPGYEPAGTGGSVFVTLGIGYLIYSLAKSRGWL